MSLGPHVDERLRSAVTTGFAHHALPPRPQLLFHHAIQIGAVNFVREVFKLRDMHAAHRAIRCAACDQVDEAHHWNAAGFGVVLPLDRMHHAIKAALP